MRGSRDANSTSRARSRSPRGALRRAQTRAGHPTKRVAQSAKLSTWGKVSLRTIPSDERCRAGGKPSHCRPRHIVARCGGTRVDSFRTELRTACSSWRQLRRDVAPAAIETVSPIWQAGDATEKNASSLGLRRSPGLLRSRRRRPHTARRTSLPVGSEPSGATHPTRHPLGASIWRPFRSPSKPTRKRRHDHSPELCGHHHGVAGRLLASPQRAGSERRPNDDLGSGDDRVEHVCGRPERLGGTGGFGISR